MSGDGGSKSPIQRIFHACLMVLGAVIALNLAVTLLRPILPWLIVALALAGLIWAATAYVRWRRSRW